MMDGMAYILTNFSSDASARSVARILMREQAITSVNIFQAHTTLYPWEGVLHDRSEVSAIFKTTVENKIKLMKRLKDLHPYELPSIVSFDADANADYVAWLHSPNGYMSSDKGA